MEDFNSEIDTSDDLRSVLGDAYDTAMQSQGSDDEAPAKELELAAKVDDAAAGRDENGRFTKADKEEPAGEQTTETTHEEKPIDAPDSWSAAQKIEWDKLPPSAQKIISEREMSFKQVQDKLKQFDPLEERLAKHDSHLAVAGTTRAQFLSNLVAAHEALLTDPSALLTIARKYGINPQTLVQQQTTQQPQHNDPLQQRLSALEAQQQAAIQAQQAQANHAIQSQIDAFASAREGDAPKHPHFNDVKPMMGAFLQAGQANGLEDAYEMACRAHPDVSRRIAEAARLAEQRQQQRVAEDAKRKSGSISGAPQSRGTSAASGDDLRSTIMAAMDEAIK